MTKVLRKFYWSPNGYDVEELQPGDERDFRSSAASLAEAGLIEIADEPVTQEILPVTFPPVDDQSGATGKRKRK